MKSATRTNPKTIVVARENPKTIVTIPNDLVEEILQHPSVNSLLRFKSVSKQWRSMIESSCFIKKHMVNPFRRLSNPKLVDVVCTTTRGLIKKDSRTFSVETYSRDVQSQKLTRLGCFTWSDTVSNRTSDAETSIEVVGSCDGLVCFEVFRNKTRVYIINPATRKKRELYRAQDSELGFLTYTGFGKDIVRGTYKVIYLYFSNSGNNVVTTKVSTLDKDCTQRNIGVFPIPGYEVSIRQTSVFANGSMFWLTKSSSYSKNPIDIVALDLYTEKFRRVSWPSWFVESCYDRRLRSLKDRLCLPDVRDGTRLWSLKDRLCLPDVRVRYPDVDLWSLKMEDSSEKWEKTLSINISSMISQLDTNVWMLEYMRWWFKKEESARWRSTLYTETIVSPYQNI